MMMEMKYRMNTDTDSFLFSFEVEDSTVHGLDGSGVVCGEIFGGEIEEHVSHVYHGFQEDVDSWE